MGKEVDGELQVVSLRTWFFAGVSLAIFPLTPARRLVRRRGTRKHRNGTSPAERYS
jgi:hypothetical protein